MNSYRNYTGRYTYEDLECEELLAAFALPESDYPKVYDAPFWMVLERDFYGGYIPRPVGYGVSSGYAIKISNLCISGEAVRGVNFQKEPKKDRKFNSKEIEILTREKKKKDAAWAAEEEKRIEREKKDKLMSSLGDPNSWDYNPLAYYKYQAGFEHG